jgi:hypothetical protein
MCGRVRVRAAVGPEPTEAVLDRRARGSVRLQHAARSPRVSRRARRPARCSYKDLGMISSVLDERSAPEPPRPSCERALPLLDHTARRSGRTSKPTYRLVQGARSRSATTATSSTPAELLGQLRGGRSQPAASTDTELLTALPRPTSRRRTPWRPFARSCPASVGRTASSSSTSGGSSACANPFGSGRSSSDACAERDATTADGLWHGDDSECRLVPVVGDGRARHRRRRVRPRRPAGELVVLEPGQPPRSFASRPRRRPCASSSSSTSPGPIPTWRGRNLYEARRRMGMQLAGEHPAEADLVMPVPTRVPQPRPVRGSLRAAVPRGHVPQPLRRPDRSSSRRPGCAIAA